MDHVTISGVLGTIAGTIHLVAFFIYRHQVAKGSSKPNASSWGLWVFLTVLNATSYFSMSGEDLAKSALTIASSFGCLMVFVAALWKGKFSHLGKTDKWILLLGGIACVVWWATESATYANMLLVACIGISFVPTLQGVWEKPKNERALPWFMWTSAYALNIVTIGLRWQGKPEELAYPILCLFLHCIVGLLSKRKTT